jgi:hypothetical protein
MKNALLIGLVFAAAAMTGAAEASSCNPCNTGVNVGANDVDLSWMITGGSSVPPLTYPSNAYTDGSNGTFPIPPWVPNSAISSWDTPTNPLTGNLDPSVNGTYDYTTTFTASPGDLFLSGIFAADNEVAAIILNGIQIYTGPTNGSSQFAAWTDFFGLASAGANTITFDVVNYGQNGGNPSGLNVEFNALAATPLPSSWTMMLIGLVGFVFVAYRRQRQASGLASI